MSTSWFTNSFLSVLNPIGLLGQIPTTIGLTKYAKEQEQKPPDLVGASGPTPEQLAAEAAQSDSARQQRNARGRASTILTGGGTSGGLLGSPNLLKHTLLGR